MIGLPRALAPWKSQLSLFPEEIALVLSPMVVRLAALIGGAPVDETPEGMPEGFDGLARRGSYDKLLATEWLILEDLPDEFLRRTVSGEHLFLHLAHRGKSAARQTVALFDAGPDQLGAPRLAQLALLIILAKRAEQCAATLKWGILQESAATLRATLTKASVRELIRARFQRRATENDIVTWTALPESRSASEVWLVGEEALAKVAERENASSVAIAELLEAGPIQRLHIKVKPSGAGRMREALIEPPDGAIGARILRDPFRTDIGGRKTSRAEIDPNAGIVFSIDGRKLFLKGQDGALITCLIPNSPRASVPRPQTYDAPEGQVLIAVGQSYPSRRMLALTHGGGELQIHTLSRRGGAARSIAEISLDGLTNFSPGDTLRPLWSLSSRCCFADAAGNLIELAGNEKAERHELKVLAFHPAPQGFSLAIKPEDRVQILSVEVDQANRLTFSKAGIAFPLMAEDAAYFFGGWGSSHSLAAYSPGESRCRVLRNAGIETFDIPSSLTLIGIANLGDVTPMFLALTGDRLKVEAFRGGSWQHCFSVPAPIVSAAASDEAHAVAYTTETGEAGLYSLVYNTTVMQVTAGTR